MTVDASTGAPDESNVLDTYDEYLLASFSLDAKRVAAYYDEPFMYVSVARTVTVATRADAEAFLSPGFNDLRRAGYARTEFPELKSQSLGKGLAVISGRGVRVTAEGKELATFGITYIWRHLPTGWKLAVMTVHDPKKILAALGGDSHACVITHGGPPPPPGQAARAAGVDHELKQRDA